LITWVPRRVHLLDTAQQPGQQKDQPDHQQQAEQQLAQLRPHVGATHAGSRFGSQCRQRHQQREKG